MIAMDDETLLRIIMHTGSRAPNAQNERDQFNRLMNEGYLRRVPISPVVGDTNDPLVCDITELGRQYLESL